MKGGNTAASFSGRMPCVDIADSIVAKGKATLERAKSVIERDFADFGAEVTPNPVYWCTLHFIFGLSRLSMVTQIRCLSNSLERQKVQHSAWAG